jgi:hypothetical protein
MNLTTKINLILAATFLVGLSVVGVNSYLLTEDNALRQVTDQADLIMQEALAVRSYTVNEVRPLLNQMGDGKFHPQTVPAYSATQTANLVRQSRPNYSYKEAVFNPTNPRDKATPAEEEIINRFRANPGQRCRGALHRAPDPDQESQVPGLSQRTRKRACGDARDLRRRGRFRLAAQRDRRYANGGRSLHLAGTAGAKDLPQLPGFDGRHICNPVSRHQYFPAQAGAQAGAANYPPGRRGQ